MKYDLLINLYKKFWGTIELFNLNVILQCLCQITAVTSSIKRRFGETFIFW